MSAGSGSVTTFLALGEVVTGDNYRRTFDAVALRELAESIAADGLGAPLLVRAMEDGTYRLVAGERRYRAHLLLDGEGRRAANGRAGAVECFVRTMTDREAAAAMLSENGSRVDPPPLEEAHGYQRAMDEFGLSPGEVAAMAGVGAYRVTMRLRLLSLSDAAQQLVSAGDLPVGHAAAMAELDHNRQRLMLAAWAESGGTIHMAGWRALVGERLAEQQQDSMFDAAAFLQTAEMVESVQTKGPNTKVLRAHLRRALAAMEAAGIAADLCADIRRDWQKSWGEPRKVAAR